MPIIFFDGKFQKSLYKQKILWYNTLQNNCLEGYMTPTVENSCCFTGHRKIDSSKLPSLVDKIFLEVSYLSEHGIKNFYAGGALGFDTIAALTVLRLRQRGDDIKLHLMLPCPEQYRNWSQRDIDIYNDILARADSKTVLCDHYHAGAMHVRNRAMVDAAGHCICFWDKELSGASKSGGGTLYTVNYARKLHRRIVNLCDEPPEDTQIEFDFEPAF